MHQTPAIKVPPLVPPYKSRCVAFFLETLQVWPSTGFELQSLKQLHEVKFGEKVSVDLFHVSKRVDEELRAWKMDFSMQEFVNAHVEFDRFVVFGMQWDPMEFLEEAMTVKHPVSASTALPAELLQVVDSLVSLGPLEVSKTRLKFFQKWSSRAKDLEIDEEQMRSTMDPVVSSAVAGKRILLFEEMVKFYNYPDLTVVDELRLGSSLVGDVPTTSMLPTKFTPAVVTADSLKFQSKMRRAKILAEPTGSGDHEVDVEVWNQTLDECSKGWLKGPLQPCDVPEDAPISDYLQTVWFAAAAQDSFD
eukprot:s60_g37.t1